MKCKKCGENLLERDQFCPQCGWKVVKERRCPDCGTLLRDGMKFCHECGRLIGNGTASIDKNDRTEKQTTSVKQETLDIPIADIEKNILMETEHEIGIGISKTKPEQGKNVPKKQKTEYEDDDYEDDEYEDDDYEEDEYEDDEYEYDDEEDEYEDEEDADEGGHHTIAVLTAVMAVLILAVAAFLVITLTGKAPIKKYGESTQAQQEAQENTQAEEQGENTDGNSKEVKGTLSIVSNVNVRDNPSTEGTNVIKVAKAGDMYQYCGKSEDGSWYEILLEDGSTGYVFHEYVKEE